MTRWAGIGLALLVAGCNWFRPEAKPHAVARVGESYLFEDDLKNLVPPGSSKADSTAIVRAYIDRWASQKLLITAAERNLGDARKGEFDGLVRQYKIDLYTKAYLEEMVRQTVDTAVSEHELIAYYDTQKENFKTTGSLVRLRFILLPKDNPKYENIKSKFFDFRKQDRKFWETYALQLKGFALNDSVWTEMNQVYAKLPFVNPDNRDQYIVPGKSIQQTDSLDVYLVKVRDVIQPGRIAPYDYLKPTLREVIVNQRKLTLIQKIEKDITSDALKDREYEIYR